MDRRNFVKSAAAALPLLSFTSSFSQSSHTLADAATHPSSALSGEPLHHRYEVTLNRVLDGLAPAYTQEFLLADVKPVAERRFTEYSGDASGRYIGALATAARVYRTPFPKLDLLVQKVIALQKPDGYFGSTFHYDKPTDNDLALLWGNGRLLVGLLEYYRYKPSAEVLASCKRLGEFLLRIAPLMLSKEIREEFGASHFASSYICWTQQTEGVANLYAVTHDDRYKLLGEEIAAVIERRPGDHVHGYLTSLRGVMDLYADTSDKRLLQQCETAWQDVAQSQDLLITGGVPEGWSPNKHRTEGCGEVDWLRLTLMLWHATSNPKYLEMAERTLFNELALNQFSTGDFGHRVLTDTGISGDGAARAWWCCTLHGLRYFPDAQSSAFHHEAGALSYDIPIDSQIDDSRTNDNHIDSGVVANARLSAVASSSLAQNGAVRITIKRAGDTAESLRLRKPVWAESITIRINGSAADYPIDRGYAEIHRRWQVGDVVSVHYGMSLRTISGDQKRTAFSYGPWLLGASAADDPVYFNELTIENKLNLANDQAAIGKANPDRSFTVPIAARTIRYTPAEFPDQKLTVTLRAVAEQTGIPTTAWEIRFLTEQNS
jgi:DUF1680 family protein